MGRFIRSVVRRQRCKGKPHLIGMGIEFGIHEETMVMTVIPMEMGENHLTDLFQIHSYLFQGPIDSLILPLDRNLHGGNGRLVLSRTSRYPP